MRIVDYEIVLKRLTDDGLECHYPNGGAFGFGPGSGAEVRGWIGPEDPTIKPAARALARSVPPPFEANLAEMATRAWEKHLSGDVWVMPGSHWSYELNYGSRDWMSALIEEMGIDPGQLMQQTNAAAMEFSLTDATKFGHFVRRLLEMLAGSDFMLAFPGRNTVCMLHHHKQLWWTTTDISVLNGLGEMICGSA